MQVSTDLDPKKLSTERWEREDTADGLMLPPVPEIYTIITPTIHQWNVGSFLRYRQS